MNNKKSTEIFYFNSKVLNDFSDLELLTRRQVSSLLKIGLSTLDQVPESELHRLRIGRSVRFTKADITEFILNKKKGFKYEKK